MGEPGRSGQSGWDPPSVEELQVLLPQYTINKILGRGGMGAVYQGLQTSLERKIAIKILPQTLGAVSADLNFIERFKLEARAMAGLDHPGIISVHDFGETTDGQLYFVMEFVDGKDMGAYMAEQGGAIPAADAISIVAQLLMSATMELSRITSIATSRKSNTSTAAVDLEGRFADEYVSLRVLQPVASSSRTLCFVDLWDGKVSWRCLIKVLRPSTGCLRS